MESYNENEWVLTLSLIFTLTSLYGQVPALCLVARRLLLQ